MCFPGGLPGGRIGLGEAIPPPLELSPNRASSSLPWVKEGSWQTPFPHAGRQAGRQSLTHSLVEIKSLSAAVCLQSKSPGIAAGLMAVVAGEERW